MKMFLLQTRIRVTHQVAQQYARLGDTQRATSVINGLRTQAQGFVTQAGQTRTIPQRLQLLSQARTIYYRTRRPQPGRGRHPRNASGHQ